MNAMIEEWIQKLLTANGLQNINDLSNEIVFEEIQEVTGTIKNEKLWVLGASTESDSLMHLGNIENLAEYLLFLETLTKPTSTV